MWQTSCGRCIYTSPSGYKVRQNPFYRWLTLGSEVLQTVVNRHNPQQIVLPYLNALSLMARSHPNEACLLGLGGAAIAHLLPNVPLTAVDSSTEVITIAKQFFHANTLINLHIVENNALDYLRQCSKTYYHLIVDLYDSQRFPKECQTAEFFLYCFQCLHAEGFLAVNIANTEEQWPIFNLIKLFFRSTLVIPIKKSTNLVILASNNRNKNRLINRIPANNLVWKPHWGLLASNY
jgi:spermidine synthase